MCSHQVFVSNVKNSKFEKLRTCFRGIRGKYRQEELISQRDSCVADSSRTRSVDFDVIYSAGGKHENVIYLALLTAAFSTASHHANPQHSRNLNNEANSALCLSPLFCAAYFARIGKQSFRHLSLFTRNTCPVQSSQFRTSIGF